MEKVILVGGKAGQGVAVTAHLIGKIFTSLGYYAFNYRDYPSLIRGGHNFNVVRISDKPVYSHTYEYDAILALDQETIDKHAKNLKKGGLLLGNKNLKSKNITHIDLSSILLRLKAKPVMGNNILIGFLFQALGVDKKFLFKQIAEKFKDKADLINKTIEEGYKLAQSKENIKTNGKAKYFISGSEAVSVGAINGGVDIYIAYPMTPATPVLHVLAAKQYDNNYLVLHLENEIGVVNAALGASLAGSKTMVGTSGGGFALMNEGISLAGISELPLVVYIAQRQGPATGIPTYTAQADLKFALSAGQGEFPRVVIAPGDPKEALVRTQEAFYLASKYRSLSIILSDKHLAESNFSFDSLDNAGLKLDRFILDNPPANYKSYKIGKGNVPKRAVLGQGPVVRGTSYEHDEYGNTVEDAEWAVKMNDKRMEKMKYIEKEIADFEPIKVYGKGKKLIIGWGSTKGAILDALSGLHNYKYMQISYMSPFPSTVVMKEIKKTEKVILVENNATGLLGDVIAEKTGYKTKNKLLKYDGRPFIAQDIIDYIKKYGR